MPGEQLSVISRLFALRRHEDLACLRGSYELLEQKANLRLGIASQSGCMLYVIATSPCEFSLNFDSLVPFIDQTNYVEL